MGDLAKITNLLAIGICRKTILETHKAWLKNGVDCQLQSDRNFMRLIQFVSDNETLQLWTSSDCPNIKNIQMHNGNAKTIAIGVPVCLKKDMSVYAEHRGQFWAITNFIHPHVFDGFGCSVRWLKTSPFLATPPKSFNVGIMWIGGVSNA